MKKTVLLMLVFATSFATVASAQKDHPAYLHALSDLRAARWMIEHSPGNWTATTYELTAVKKIDAAIADIKDAAIDDGKDISDHPAADEINQHKERLTKAIEWLKKARTDISKDEDNVYAKGLRKRALGYIDEAIKQTEKARVNAR